MRIVPLVLAAGITIGGVGKAQVIERPVLSRAGVDQVLQAAEAEAKRNGWAVSIAVTDPSGLLLGFIRLDDAPPSSIDIALGKARTSARFRRPSKALEDLAGARVGFVAIEGIVPVEGGIPIVVGDRIVGAIGVSGVTSGQDAQVARAGLEKLLPSGR